MWSITCKSIPVRLMNFSYQNIILYSLNKYDKGFEFNRITYSITAAQGVVNFIESSLKCKMPLTQIWGDKHWLQCRKKGASRVMNDIVCTFTNFSSTNPYCKQWLYLAKYWLTESLNADEIWIRREIRKTALSSITNDLQKCNILSFRVMRVM